MCKGGFAVEIALEVAQKIAPKVADEFAVGQRLEVGSEFAWMESGMGLRGCGWGRWDDGEDWRWGRWDVTRDKIWRREGGNCWLEIFFLLETR